MKKILLVLAIGLGSLGVLGTGCGHAPIQSNPPVPRPSSTAPKADVSIEAKMVAAEAGSSFVTEIFFAKGVDQIPTDQFSRIDASIRQATQYAPLASAVVVAWSDQEMPTKNQKELSPEEVDLADHRANSIKAYIQKNQASVRVDTVNMAKRSSRLKQALQTQEARIQKSLQSAGVPEIKSGNEPAQPKASRAIVIFFTQRKS